ncbi:hypothetical protein I316_00512 [Kwoniella heveanensis BCC8398]|uniref:Major facilitator superfamily (MFS) profile domain-containing protein n=1 Tax=Kwoniella heveanensis BCC8398 TaxID=1296120 RepID=A0A1B9H295_9TREE|nr:hypothetical protein I316_00512 [Kwoniella heveanensis BCC8398]
MSAIKITPTTSYTEPNPTTQIRIVSRSPSSSSSTLKASPHERTALLPTTNEGKAERRGFFPPVRRVMFTSFLLSMTFAFTQTSLLYAFRIMACDEYHKTHEWTGPPQGDRCAITPVEGNSARQIALMGATTTTCTIANLFVTGWFIKRFGVKAAMFQQTFWAAFRNLCQMYALSVGGGIGIKIIQTTQMFNILGSAGGYQIASNVFIAALVDAEQRTSQFGVLTGVIMLGSSAGYTLGGLAFNYFGLLAPFKCAFALLCFCTIFGSLFLPYLAPDHKDETASPTLKAEKRKQSFLAPLKIFIPKLVEKDGKLRRDYNLLLLGAGAFFSVLATGYVGVALQLVGTDAFGFMPGQSGMMLSGNLLVKAFFLSICFPRIITYGRRLLSHRTDVPSSAASDEHPETPLEAEEPDDVGAPREDQARAPTDVLHGSTFDLYFLRWSIFVDGVLTGLTTLSSKGWHLYLAAGVLPFASATGAACKGVTLDFVSQEERADALGAIALVEKVAQVSTISLFGYAFALFSERGQPTLVFLANGSIAMVAFLLLLFVKIPKPEQGKIALPA